MAAKKILIIDDDDSLLKVLEISLTSYGFEPHLAASAEKAFELLKNNSYDLVILDFYLPKTDGGQICRELRANPEFQKNQKAPVLILTGIVATEEALAAKVTEFGANDFLAKPFETKDLLEKIHQLA